LAATGCEEHGFSLKRSTAAQSDKLQRALIGAFQGGNLL
jgi:hypothetical protein